MSLGSCFVTGTDTEIGKTHVACTLLHHWRRHGFKSAGYKPVAAGGMWKDGRLTNDDAERLLAASSPGVSIEDINPVCLEAAIAPHVAARDMNREIALTHLIKGFEQLSNRFDRVVVEGVGGFRVPLGRDFDSADLAVALNLPIVLVVGLRLGCINHALLSVEAILGRKLKLAGWLGNTLLPAMERQDDTIATLQCEIPAPCLGILPRSLIMENATSVLKLTSS